MSIPDDVGRGLPLLGQQLGVVHDLLQEADHFASELVIGLKVLCGKTRRRLWTLYSGPPAPASGQPHAQGCLPVFLRPGRAGRGGGHQGSLETLRCKTPGKTKGHPLAGCAPRPGPWGYGSTWLPAAEVEGRRPRGPGVSLVPSQAGYRSGPLSGCWTAHLGSLPPTAPEAVLLTVPAVGLRGQWLLGASARGPPMHLRVFGDPVAEDVQDAVGGRSADHELLVPVPLVRGKPCWHRDRGYGRTRNGAQRSSGLKPQAWVSWAAAMTGGWAAAAGGQCWPRSGAASPEHRGAGGTVPGAGAAGLQLG